MNEQTAYEQYYQAWIKRHLRTILWAAAACIALGVSIETRHYLQSQHQRQAQALLEDYLDAPNTQSVALLVSKYPHAIQTHLVLYSEAKKAYEQGEIEDAIGHLDFIRINSQEEAVKKIATYRLAALYREQSNFEQSKSILNDLEDDDAYTQFQLALSLEDPEEREAMLNEALSASDNPYLKNLIAIAHNELLEQ